MTDDFAAWSARCEEFVGSLTAEKQHQDKAEDRWWRKIFQTDAKTINDNPSKGGSAFRRAPKRDDTGSFNPLRTEYWPAYGRTTKQGTQNWLDWFGATQMGKLLWAEPFIDPVKILDETCHSDDEELPEDEIKANEDRNSSETPEIILIRTNHRVQASTEEYYQKERANAIDKVRKMVLVNQR